MFSYTPLPERTYGCAIITSNWKHDVSRLVALPNGVNVSHASENSFTFRFTDSQTLVKTNKGIASLPKSLSLLSSSLPVPSPKPNEP